MDLQTPADDDVITSPEDVIGTVNDSNLLNYTLDVTPLDGGSTTVFAHGTSKVTGGTLGRFDPSVLANGTYILTLTAMNLGNHTATVAHTINVAGNLKLGNFTLSFTDLTIPVAGIPITVSRTYDTLNANNSEDFGYGWQLAFRDTDLRTSVPNTGSAGSDVVMRRRQ